MCTCLLTEKQLILETTAFIFSWQVAFQNTVLNQLKKKKKEIGKKRRNQTVAKKYRGISVFAKTFLGHFSFGK